MVDSHLYFEPLLRSIIAGLVINVPEGACWEPSIEGKRVELHECGRLYVTCVALGMRQLISHPRLCTKPECSVSEIHITGRIAALTRRPRQTTMRS